MSDDNFDLSDPVARREFRDRNLRILAAQSNSEEFKKVVDDVVNGRKSLFAASQSGDFADTMSEMVTKALEANEDPVPEEEPEAEDVPPRAASPVPMPDPRALPMQEPTRVHRPPELPKPAVPPSRNSFDPDDFWSAGNNDR